MTPKKLQERRERIIKLNTALKNLFPKATIALHHSNPLELLIAVILSAQCTDKKVNEITEKLFQKYKTLDDYIHAKPMEFELDIHSAGFFRNKTKNILVATKMIHDNFGGEVPRTMLEILRIPGVARKTANIVLGNAYGVIEGIAVDTHVLRFVHRFNLSDYKDPVRIERDLMVLLPKKEWQSFTYRVIEYGRNIAPARKYDTSRDSLVKIYPQAAKVFRV